MRWRRTTCCPSTRSGAYLYTDAEVLALMDAPYVPQVWIRAADRGGLGLPGR